MPASKRPQCSHTALHSVPHLKWVMMSCTIYDNLRCLSVHFGAGSSDREETSARMPSCAIFAPLRPKNQRPWGRVPCRWRLSRDCAVAITASFDMIAATTVLCQADIMQYPWAAGHPR